MAMLVPIASVMAALIENKSDGRDGRDGREIFCEITDKCGSFLHLLLKQAGGVGG